MILEKVQNSEEDKEEPTVCSMIWNPVCGKDGRTYSNKCFVEIAKVEVDYSGKCIGIVQAEKLSWNEALKILNSGQVTHVDQTHSKVVSLVLKNGTKFITEEPNIDDIVKEVKKCGEPCKNILISTE